MAVRLVVLSVALWLCSHAAAQVARVELDLANPTTVGSRSIPARVYYPSRRESGPLPVIVFLHGLSKTGADYGSVGTRLAARGYVVVLPHTGRWNAIVQGQDAIATYAALQSANRTAGSVLQGLLDMDRVGLAGHSMGGANTVRVLADNPGYKVGACLAPLAVPPGYASRVRVPIAFVGGKGDTVTPWRTHLMPAWQGATRHGGVKVLCVFDEDANHWNVVHRDFAGAQQHDREIFDRSFAVMTGLFDHYLRGDERALDGAVGSAARSDRHIAIHRHDARVPTYYKSGSETAGKTTRLHVLAAPGLAVQLAALGGARIATQWGVLGLDPGSLMVAHVALVGANGTSVLSVPIPRGRIRLHYQALAVDAAGRLRLTRTLGLTTRS